MTRCRFIKKTLFKQRAQFYRDLSRDGARLSVSNCFIYQCTPHERSACPNDVGYDQARGTGLPDQRAASPFLSLLEAKGAQ